MAKIYNTPELYNAYCTGEGPIGKTSMKKVVIEDFDQKRYPRMSLRLV